MQIKSLFPTPLVTCDLDGSESLIPALRERILKRAAEVPGVSRSNEGGWQSAPDFPEWSGSSGEALTAAITEIVNRFTVVNTDSGLQRLTLNWRLQAWANVNRRGHANAAHFHPGAFWSAVFYVDDGGIDGKPDLGGAIEFADPRGPAPVMYAPNVKMGIEGCVLAGLQERVFPRTGQLLLFPAWLGHSVAPYTGDRTRISVTINYCV